MTSERYNPIFLGAHAGKHRSGLPSSLGERLRSSFESLRESTSEDGRTVEDSMEMSMMEELEPDYGDEVGDRDSSIHSGELSTLPDLTDTAVLDVVRTRYKRDLIYTSCGDVLISVNPFKQLNIFDETTHEAYSLDALSGDVHLQPHVFWVASQAIARRARDQHDQVVLVSGESGAGKTEATKLMLRHILHLSASRQDRLFESIDKVNPLLELFGNARTVLNDNSSRFAKFLDVRFTPDGAVTGAIIRDYILEKSRVVRPSPRESNFHIFYTFLDDVIASPARQKQFLMEGMDKSHFRIVPGDSWQHSGSRMSTTEQAKVFRQIGIPQEEVDNMHVILAAILHLSNIRFVDEDSSSGGVVVENEDTMNKAACLLSVDPEKLAMVLVTTKATFSGEEMVTFKSHSKADETRDAIAKALYERLFGWLIRRINTALNRSLTSEAGIGFLDICGFEDLHKNSLEQLCINLSNEHLQRFMNTQVFEHEMKIYKQEGIALDQVKPPSNEDILDLFNRPKTGILALVNEDTKHMELATDKTLVRKIIDRHAHSHHFLRYKNDDPRFGIKHFAVPVWYCAEDFLRKNGDSLSKEAQEIMVSSSNELISDIFQVQKASTGSIAPTQYNYRASQRRDMRFSPLEQTGISMSVLMSLKQSLKGRFGSKVPKVDERTQPADQNTAIDYFQDSMKDLLRKMEKAQPLFVRCIKPNDMQSPDRFDDKKVQLQLRYNGVTEIARIRRVWFPVRIPYTHFLKRYCELSPKAKGIADKVEAVNTILQQFSVGREQCKIGRTMVFLKDGVCEKLEKELVEIKRKKREEEERQKREEEKRKKAEEEQKRREEEEKKKKMAGARRPKHVQLAVAEMETIAEADTPKSSLRSAPPFKTSPGTSAVSSVAGERSDDTELKVPIGSGASSEAELQTSEGEQPPNDDAEDDKKNDYWDIFRTVAREQPITDIHHMRAMKIIKTIVFFLLFVVVLVTATAQKVSLMLMLFAMSLDTQTKVDPSVSSAYYILVVVAVCLPYILTFLTSLAKVAFGGFRNPSVATWLWVLVVESLHTFGLALLVFRVLPRLDIVHGLLLMCAVAMLPSLLKPVMGVEIRGPRFRNFLCVFSGFLDFLAMAGQLSVLPVIILLDYVPTNGGGDVLNVMDVVGAVVCVSFAYWENFMDGKFFVQLGERNVFKNFVLKRRFEMERGRYIPQVVTSAWKIALTFVLAYLFRGGRNFDYQSAFTSLGTLGVEQRAVTAIAVLTLSGLVCYYFSYIACKLWMQRISFSMPLTMATPCAILVFYLNTHYNFLTEVTPNGTGNINNKWPSDLFSHLATLGPGVAWFVSLLILTRHIWFPRHTRLAKIQMLFMNPLFCGILTTESLLLNRRRHTLSCRKKRDANSNLYYRLDHHEHARNSAESDYTSGSGMYSEIGDTQNTSGQTLDEETMYGGAHAKKGEEDIPMIYACATMWHELRREMVALLKSLHRIDLEQWTRKQAQEMSKTRDKDFFDYEAHIFFDDAMTLDDDEEFVPNDYVKMLVEVMEEAVSSVYKKSMTVAAPFKIPTPYGGQLLWLMPGGNLLFVHLKDKAKIRHRKRWSQVMYMYYLLGFRLTRQCQQQILEALQTGKGDEQYAWAMGMDDAMGNTIFEMLDDSIAQKSQNTFVMALDGDTDFYPGAVHILLDRMKKNPKVGAACGRIHPIGSGPMVWYQIFEYAIGHWMQKATEHVLGCVLCSPGCFSLFRGSALMDDNVMRKYTVLPTEPGHFLQYDQGEDRWLCTLLLQQGYRVDYAAAADAWTYAPEGFNEFFNQRRRWMPSTLANVMDLLSDYSNTVAVNSNISMLYIIYQVALMVATLLGPGTVLMMIAGAIGVVFQLDLIWSYVITLVPAVIFIIICIYCKTQTQLYVAGVLSTFYSFVMMIVFVGTIVTAVEKSIFHPSVLVIAFLVIIFLMAGLCHPLEIYCLPSGALYLLCIPSGYLLLVIYSLCNLHIVSWGTREAPKKKTKAEMEQEKLEEEKKKEEKAKKKGIFSGLFFSNYLNDLKDIIQTATGRKTISADEDKSLKLLEQINTNLIKLNKGKETDSGDSSATGLREVAVDSNLKPAPEGTAGGSKKKSVSIAPAQEVIQDKPEAAPAKPTRNELENPKWIEDKGLGDGGVMKLFDEECIFWKRFLARYLKPLEADKQKEKEDSQKLIELRNSVCFGVGMINLLWIAINFMFQLTNPVTVTIPLDGGIDVGIMGLLFVIFLLAVLLLQIFGMIIHRWGTLLHLLAFTDISCPCFQTKVLDAKEQKERDLRKAFDFCQEIIREPMPDYADDGAEIDPRNARAHLAATIKQKLQQSIVGSQSIQRQTVTQQLLNDNVISGPGFLNSNSVRLYLQGTRRSDEEDDQTARDFVGEFRSVMNGRARGQYSQRNGYARQFSGSSANSRRVNGFPPPVPPRAGNASNMGVRRRIHANNLRYTARDVIEKARDRGINVEGPRGQMTEDFGGGMMDRAFSRRVRKFSQYASGPGRNYVTDIEEV